MSDQLEQLRPITCLEMKKSEPDSFEKTQMRRDALKEIFNDIQAILRDYLDTSEENYTIITLWIIGTYYHDQFLTYPYLFFNAMRGSAKTRTLKIIKYLAKNGDMLASLSEAVLFRTTGTLCIDEFERIDNKDKNALRELLNTAYKKGGAVKRMRKKKTMEGEVQVVEQFDTFRPITMANISGMEEVLGDRCITLVLEKSGNPLFTKKVEDFDWNPLFKKVTSELLSVLQCSLCNVVTFQKLYMGWNSYTKYIYTNYIHTLTTSTTYNTLNTQNTLTTSNCIPQFSEELELFYTKINSIGIDGRNLELFFPLIILSKELGILDDFLIVVQKVVAAKKADEVAESKDVMLYQFVSAQSSEWYNVKELTSMFRTFCADDYSDEPWLNPKWMGRALKKEVLRGIASQTVDCELIPLTSPGDGTHSEDNKRNNVIRALNCNKEDYFILIDSDVVLDDSNAISELLDEEAGQGTSIRTITTKRENMYFCGYIPHSLMYLKGKAILDEFLKFNQDYVFTNGVTADQCHICRWIQSKEKVMTLQNSKVYECMR